MEGIEYLAVLSGKAIRTSRLRWGARGDGIDEDVLFGELEAQAGFGEAFDRVLGRGVDADLAHANVTGNA